jgi:hypothetical protein
MFPKEIETSVHNTTDSMYLCELERDKVQKPAWKNKSADLPLTNPALYTSRNAGGGLMSKYKIFEL